MNLNNLLDKYDKLPLECDGLTRVLDRVLTFHNIPHKVIYGTLSKGKSSLPHYWIQLVDGRIADYRARMWFNYEAPHGIFNPFDQSVVKYEVGSEEVSFYVPDYILKVFGVNPENMELL